MAMSSELFLSILAMDSYNRGYGAKIDVGGTTLGDASLHSLVTPQAMDAEWKPLGFFVQKYTLGSQAYLAYRGTDDLPDVFHGWIQALGFEKGTQAALAVSTFEAAAGHSVFDQGKPNPIVTGHSLGGGLAGYVALLSGADNLLLDHMPYGISGISQFQAELARRKADREAQTGVTMTETGDALVAALGMHKPDFREQNSIFVDGEGLQLVREGAIPYVALPVVVNFANLLNDPYWTPLLVDWGYTTVGQLMATENQIPRTPLYTADWTNAFPLDRHSGALLVILQYASEGAATGAVPDTWYRSPLANTFLWSLFDDHIGQLAGADRAPGLTGSALASGQYSEIIKNTLAYSSIDTGTRPYGDMGISVLFDDLNDLATVLLDPGHFTFLDEIKYEFGIEWSAQNVVVGVLNWAITGTTPPQDFSASYTELLARIVTQYGAALSVWKVSLAGASSHSVDLTDGIVTLASDFHTFAVDLSTVMWGDVLGAPAPLEIVDREYVTAKFFTQSEETDSDLLWMLNSTPYIQVDQAALSELAQLGWEATTADIFDRLHLRWFASATDFDLSDRSYDTTFQTGNRAHVDVFVSTAQDDTVFGTSGNDLLLTEAGNDTVHGGTGRDFVIAGPGDDVIYDGLGMPDLDGVFSNDPDTYVGERINVDGNSLLESFRSFVDALSTNPVTTVVNLLHWSTKSTGDDVLSYSVQDPRSPGAYAAKGVTLTGLTLSTLGDNESIALTLNDENSGKTATDQLLFIDKVVLTERADTVSVDANALDAPIWIDMGLGVPNGTFGKADYDAVSYLGAGQPIVTVNGATQAGNGNNGSLTSVSYLQLITELVGSAIDFPAAVTPVFSGFQANDPLRVTGAEKVTLTASDDVLWYGSIGDAVGAITGWPAGDLYPHFGEIHGDAGNDVLVVRDARYVFSGEAIDPNVPDSPKAAGDLRLEIDGGEGEDRVMAIGGTGAITVGGPDRDFLFNWTYKGQIFGDGIDGNGGADDIIWWSVGAFLMDAEKGDRLQMFGIPLTGGFSHEAAGDGQAIDWALPFVRYGYTGAKQLIVSFGDPSTVSDVLTTAMVVNDYDFGTVPDNPGFSNFSVMEIGDLGMTFRIYDDGGKEISLWAALWGHLMSYLQAMQIFAKSLHWDSSDDPLVLDLDGDGIETIQLAFGPQFDLDGDGFAQRTGWVGADDGLLVRDLNGNGLIDDVSELFGAPDQPGFGMLAALDGNGDGLVDAADANFATLRVWRDLDEDGVTDAGELKTLAETGIRSIGTGAAAIDQTAANGNRFVAEGQFTWNDGHSGKVVEAIFDTNPVETRYLGDGGRADWSSPIDSRGYGKLTQLATAAANDLAVDTLLRSTAVSMTTPDMEVLRQQAQPVLEAWAEAITQSRELAPVLVGAGGQRLDHGVWHEDAVGGWWALASGASVRAADGSVIARPTLEQVVAQGVAAGAAWRVEQLWTPADRTAGLAHREEVPYLVTLAEGRATVVDHGVRVTDASGSYWALASGQAITGAGGAAIARAQLADVLASPAGAGASWRVESFGVAEAPFPFEKTAVYYKGGVLTDYAVQVTDGQGSFFVWSGNLRLALDYQDQNGVNGFGLRNYALDLDHLKDADNTADSYVRAEIVTGGQLKYGAAAYGIVFEPDILMAQVGADGLLRYDAPIESTTAFLGDLMTHYSFFSRAVALHLAAQGGLAGFFRGLDYDAQDDAWIVTGGRELAPMFEAIFEDAPAGRDAAASYLEKWGEIMNVIYPDLHTHASGAKTQDFVFQMVLAAWENVPTDVELLKAAEAFGVDEEAIIQHDAAATAVNGTSGDDIFRLGPGDQIFRGGLGHDVYVVGKDFGHDVIEDIEPPLGPRDVDLLRFSHVASTDVHAYKNGIDLVLEVIGTGNVLTVRNQFEGALPSLFGGDLSNDTEMVTITFADGVTWDELAIAWATSHPQDTDDLVQGTPDIDVLDGGRGNDILRGGRESDLYVFDLGYGNDRIEDDNDNILVTHYDVLQFGSTLDADALRFTRVGDSNDLVVRLLDDAGHDTGDQVTVTNQFWAINTWVFGVQWLDRIERFVFGAGTFLTEADIMRITLEDAKTDAEDAIFGFHAVDTLDGGAANDYLSGGDEGDTYIFARGYGHDVIEDNLVDFLSPSQDTLKLGFGIAPTDLELVRNGSEQTVMLVIAGTDDRVTLSNTFKLTSTVLFGDYYYDSVDEVRFFDGTVWDMDTMARMLLAQVRTDGDDTLYGFDRNDEIDGGAGDDRLEGGSYSDTYIFRHGYGHDTIYDASTGFFLAPGWDTLQMSDVAFDDIVISRFKEDLIFTVRATGESVTLAHQYNRLDGQANAIEVLRFADQTVSYLDLNPEDVDLVGTPGDDTLWGTHFAETIDGRAGNDLLLGSSDGDTYRFDAGYGHDTIFDLQESRAWFNDDHVVFGADITVTNVVFSKDGNDLVVGIVDRPDTLRIRDQFSNPLAGVEQFHFHDGTTWSITDVEELLLIAGGGRGDDVIVGLADQENILDGRLGDDQLFGGRAADTYLFGLGYGLDTVTEVPNAQSLAGAVDKVFFGSLVEPDALLVRRAGGDLIFTLVESGDELRVVNGLDQRLVEEFRFADSTVWTLADVKLAMLRGTDGDDLLIGFDDSADLLDGGRGSDELEGGLGDDVYRFGIGHGDDGLLDQGGAADRIEFGALITATQLQFAADGDNLVIHLLGTDDSLVVRDTLGLLDGARRIEELRFADGLVLSFDQVRQALLDQQSTAGDDIVTGFADRADLIAGSAGADEMVGQGGGDTYRIGSGHGRDIVDDRGASALDRIVFTGYGADQALVRRLHPTSSDVLVGFIGTNDEVLIKGGLEEAHASAIEEIEFADGRVWTIADLRTQVLDDATTAGNDTVTGFAGNDRIDAGRGDDTLYGQAGSDTYVFTRGDGHDLVRDPGGAADTDVVTLEGYVPDDVKVLRPQADRPDLLLVLGDAGDEILLRDQMTTTAGAGIEQVKFGDGTVWTRTDLVGRISAGGTGGDDAINGGSSGEFIIGRGGDDRLSGGDGSDTYVYTRGDGRDIIEDNGFADTDVVQFVGYAPADLVLSRALEAPDTLIIRFAGSADELRIVNTLDSDIADQIERFEFAGGAAWTIAEVKAMLVPPADPLADNIVTGLDSNDTLAGGLGEDQLFGGDGSDTYIYRRNDGNDTIEDKGFADTDVLGLQGYLPGEVLLSTAPEAMDTLLIRFAGNDDVLRVVNTLDFDLADQVERVQFDDGTVWTMDDVRARLVAQQQSALADVITGFAGSEQIVAGTGDDLVHGADGSDTYVYARGDGRDTIDDNGFADTDVLRIQGWLPGEVSLAQAVEAPDTLILRFTGSVDEIRIVNTLDFDLADALERIEFTDAAGVAWSMDDVRSRLVLQQQSASADRVTAFAGNDQLAGGLGDDELHGGDGSDTYVFARGDGRDTIEDDGFADTDVVRLQGLLPSEVTLGRALEASDTLVLRVAATGDELRVINTLDNDLADQIERFDFDNGTSWTIADVKTMLASVPLVTPTVGTAAADTMESTPATEILQGKAGNDRYVWARGDGADVVDDTVGAFDGDADRLVLQGVAPGAVGLQRSGDDAILVIAESAPGAGDGGRLVLKESLNPSFQRGIESIAFDDGTLWTPATLRGMLVAAAQTAGNDRVVGFTTVDVLEGRAGNDYLAGGGSSDSYVYTRGDGDDVVDDSGNLDGSADVLRLQGVDAGMVRVQQSANDAILLIPESAPLAGDGGRLVLKESLNPSFERGVESIVFDSGTVWTPATLRLMLIAAAQTSGNDQVSGYTTADRLQGGPGDDLLAGGGSSDTYVWQRGDGSDVVDDSGNLDGPADRLELHGVDPATVKVTRSDNDAILAVPASAPGVADGGRIVVRQSLDPSFERGVEQIAFDNGTVWTQSDLRSRLLADARTDEGTTITGFSAVDALEGGRGDDLLIGRGGSDFYVWNRGDGNDVFDDSGTFDGTADTVVLRGVEPADATLEQGDGADLVLVIRPTTPLVHDGARIVLKVSSEVYFERGIESIVFDDGTVWNRAGFSGQALVSAATEGDDVITGSAIDDRIVARGGNDLIRGADGADTYVMRAGDGRDVIDDNGDGDTDAVEIRGHTPAQTRFMRVEPGSNDLLIRFDGSDDTVTIVDGLAGNAADTVEEFRFVDAASGLVTETLTLAQVSARLLIDARTAGNDQITGTGANDLLGGGAGSDVLDGAGGDDTYEFRRGDGDDRIDDTGTTTGDVLSLPDFNPSDLVSVRRSPPAGLDLVLTFAGRDRVVLANSLDDGAQGVETIVFKDGTRWTSDELRQRVLDDASTDGSEQLWGFAGGDVMAGAKGDDVLHGGDGSDTYRYAPGDGHDVIEDDGNGDVDRIDIAGYTSAQVSVERFYKGDDGIVLRFAGSDDTLTVLNTLGGSSADGIEQIAFADGVVWTMADALAALDNDPPVAARDGFFAAVQGRALSLQPAQLLVNDFDPDGDPLTIVAVGHAEHGSVQLDAAGRIVFTAAADFVGVTSFEYTVSDGRNGLATQTVSLRVRPPASASDDSGLGTAEDTLLSIRVERLLANDFDGDLMVVSQVLDARHGTVSLSSSGDITFVPAADYVGPASFRYVANTPDGGRAEATVTIDVTPVNDAPVARNDTGLTTPEGTPLTVAPAALLANDGDVDGDTLTLTGVVGDAHVQASINAQGQVVLAPVADFFGRAQVTYTVADGHGGTASAQAAVDVTPVNDAPTPAGDALVTDEDVPLFFPVADLLANDSDPDGDVFTVVRVFGFDHGTAQLFANGTILFEPGQNYYGMAGFRYEVDDGQGGLASARVDVQVNPFNDAPVARDEHYGDPGVDWLDGTEDQVLTIPVARLLANDSDRDSLSITLASVSFASHGSVQIVGDQVAFTPDAGYWGEASFSYIASDGDGGVDDALVTMYFEPTSDAPPEAGNDEVSIFEDVTTVVPITQLLANDSDIDADTLTVLWIAPFSVLDAAAVDLSRDARGDLVIAPAANVNGRVTLLYEVSDGRNGSDIGTITVQIVPVNDDPQATDDTASTTLDAPLVVRLADLPLNDDDLDFDDDTAMFAALHVVGVQGPSVGTLWTYQGEFAVLEAPLGTTGDVSFAYVLGDEAGGTDLGLVHGTISAARAAVITGTARRDLLIGSADGERLEGLASADDLYGRAGDDELEGGDGADRLDGGDGVDTASYDGSNVGLRADLEARIGQGGHAAGDLYLSIESLRGSAFADQLYGDSSVNRLDGAGGSDLLDGRGGADALDGGAGNDRLVGGAGADALEGGDGTDTADYADSAAAVTVSLLAGTGAGGDAEGDTLHGIENLTGSGGDDQLTGDDTANRLEGGRGADHLVGGAGNDALEGGRDSDTLEGGDGSDTADYSLSQTGVTVDLSGQTAGGGDAQGDVYGSIENVHGSFHDDVLAGDGGNNRIEGGDGADTLRGGGGFDFADYHASASAVTVDLGAGTGSGGEAQGDTLEGIAGLIGSPWDDRLSGDASSNVFVGGYGRDRLAGAGGSDDYRFGFGGGDDTVTEGGAAADIDRVVLDADVPTSAVGLVRRGDDLIIELEKGEGFLVDTVTVKDHFVDAAAGIELIVFGDGTQWDRAEIDLRARAYSFQAADDLVRFADEDLAYSIAAARLTANDADGAASDLAIIGVSNARHGTATLEANGSVTFLGSADFFGDASFDYTVADSLGRQSTATARVVVRGVNDAPVAGDDGTYHGAEDTVIVIPISSLLANDSDVDGDALQVGGFGPLVDENGQYIGEAADAGFAAAATNGVVTFDLFGPNLLFIPFQDHYGAAGFSYTLSDGQGGTDVANVLVEVSAVNDGPRSGEDNFATRMGTPLAIDPLALTRNDRDAEGDPIELLRVSEPANGTVTLDASGRVVFTPEPGFLGRASFVYVAGDGRGGEGRGTVWVDVIPLNDPPRAGNDRYDLAEDQPLVLAPAQLLANDSDPNGDPLVISRLDLYPEKGSVAFDAQGQVVFTPKANYNGDASFYYWISDGRGEEARGTVNLQVAPDNDPPFVTDDGEFTTAEDTLLVIPAAQLFANDGDPDGDVLSFGAIVVEHGSVARVGADLQFTPDTDFVGTATVSYRAVDVKGAVSPTAATFNVVVSSAADLPVAGADAFSVRAGSVLTVQPASLLSNDRDGDGDPIRLVSVQDAEHGTVELLPDGSVRFTPETGFEGSAGFGYTITDDVDGEAAGQVGVTVLPPAENRLPVAGLDRLAVAEDQTVTVTVASLLANDSDTDGDSVRFVSVAPDGDNGRAVLLPGPNIAFTPDDDFFGTVHFSYKISDGIGADVTGQIELQVTPVNDGPDGVDDFGYVTVEDQTLTIALADLLANDSDVEGDAFALVGTRDVFNGSVQIVGDELRFTPAPGFFGGAAFTYLLRDLQGAEGSAQVSISVLPGNHPPVANDDMGLGFDEDASIDIAIADLLANDTDPDGDVLALAGFGSASGGTLQQLDAHTLRFIGGANFNGDASFRYRIADPGGREDEALVTLSARALNDAPTANDDRGYQTAEDSALVIPVLALLGNDFDIDRGSFQLVSVSPGVGGTAALDGAGNVRFTPTSDFSGTAAFEYGIQDLFGLGDTARVEIEVTALNDAPRPLNDAAAVARDDRLLIEPQALLANDTDAEGDALLLLAAGGAAHGQVAIDARGRVVYTPDEGYVGRDQFIYTVGDGQASAQAAVDVDVTDPYVGWRQGSAGNDTFGVNLRLENRVYGAGGDDTINGGTRDDRLSGGRGNDKLIGLAGDDVLDGGDGNDQLGGGAGNDVLIGGRGDDELAGGWGADTFVFRRGDGRDTVLDFGPGASTGPYGLGGDRINLRISGVDGFNGVMQYAHQTVLGVEFDFGEGDTLLIRGAQLQSINGDWFTFP